MPRKLPNKLSALLRLAVEDAKICAKQRGYTLDMNLFHVPDYGRKTCRVCMAGAVLAVERQVPWRWDSNAHARLPDHRIMFAIDYMRHGNMELALSELLGGRIGARLAQRLVYSGALKACGAEIRARWSSPSYRAPWPVYMRAAKKLEALGL